MCIIAEKRYEISDEQWIQIKQLFPLAKTLNPPKQWPLIKESIDAKDIYAFSFIC